MVRTRFLLLDTRVVAHAERARLRVCTARRSGANPLLGEEHPWEPRFDNLYPNVVREGGTYRCWYNVFTIDPGSAQIPPSQRHRVPYPAGRMGPREMGLCYAESDDGVHWRKPLLQQIHWGGSRTNLLARGPHGAGVFRDARDPDPGRRYKMIFRDEHTMAAAFSADGMHWSSAVPLPDLDVPGDTHNNAFWAPTLGKYVCITRMVERRSGGRVRAVRLVARSESDDFIRWSRPRVVLRGLEDHLQVYSMPVFAHAGVYLGLPAIFDLHSDRVHTELAWSPDTRRWHRVDPGRALLANSRRKGGLDWGCVYAAAYPVFTDRGVELFYGGGNDTHMSWRRTHLALATLRPDGFAGYEPLRRRGSVTTRALPWRDGSVCVSADVQRHGAVAAVALDGAGGELARSLPVRRSGTDTPLRWPGSVPLPAGTSQLRFELDRARLYSFSLFIGDDP